MIKELQQDSVRYADLGGWHGNSGFWIGVVYRFGAWAHGLPILARIPLWSVYRLARGLIRLAFNVDFWAGPRGVSIGGGLCLIHPTQVIIAQGTHIGENCLIFHEVTIGTGPTPGTPRIGNDVDIYVGARILGGVTIGDGAMIGPNCVVMADVPARTVIMPAVNLKIPRGLSPVASQADVKRRTG
jgi:serine acetyltransferase